MLIGFQKQFADKVASGEKTQTIRAYRKRPFKEFWTDFNDKEVTELIKKDGFNNKRVL